MKFNMICVKYDQKIKKNLNLDFLGFLDFLKSLKKPTFFRSHFPALSAPKHSVKWLHCAMYVSDIAVNLLVLRFLVSTLNFALLYYLSVTARYYDWPVKTVSTRRTTVFSTNWKFVQFGIINSQVSSFGVVGLPECWVQL